MKRWIKRIVICLIVLSILGAAAGWYFHGNHDEVLTFKTAKVTRGSVLVSISASGTLEPEEVIDVGAQIAGQIRTLGTDRDGQTVDFRSVVEAGAVLARIDDSVYQAELVEATAQLQQAEASLKGAQADLLQLQARHDQAQRDWQRAQKIGSSEALAQSSYDSYEAAYKIAVANIAVGEAAIAKAQAAISQAQAGLERAKRNLGYCTIVSPVDGVIIDRRVSIGQTVVAGLNAPSLFLIAKDLRRMQVWVAVNEADIARIHPKQAVTFTVDALPDETFHGEVIKVRLNASMTQNVVTYIVEIATDNDSGRLLPYLTANVQFEVDRRDDVFLVPAASLHWTPTIDQVAPEYRQDEQAPAAGQPPVDQPSADRATAGQPASDQTPVDQTADGGNHDLKPAILWIAQGRYVRPIAVLAGLSDGTVTQVIGEGLSEGLEVVTGTQSAAAAASQTDVSNPFTPKLPKPPGKGGPPPA
ncbi:MAG: efflux RND transporter periplasmic adaptor subunit [Sedimentisphaerales bacterium]|nr:efflux RND transporter periplasmic adaptor subunit [Sedimentisphaerales bacterium]